MSSLSAQAKAFNSDTDGLSPQKTSKTSSSKESSSVVKYDENSNERTVELEQSGGSSPSSPKNRTSADVSNQSQPDEASDTRSPAERSLAKLFGKRKAHNREKATGDSSEYHSADSANSPPQTSPTVEVKSETLHTEAKSNKPESPRKDAKKSEEIKQVREKVLKSEEKREVSAKLQETVAPQVHDKLQSVPDLVGDIKDTAVTVESPKVEKRQKEKSKHKKSDKSEVKRKSAAPEVPEQGSPRPRSATHTGSPPEKVPTKSDKKKPLTLSGIQALLRPRSSTHSGAARPQSVAEAPPRPPPRRQSKKRRQAPTPPGVASPTSPTSPSSPSKSDRPLTREEKASRRISSPPQLQTFDLEARSPSGSSTSSSSATPVTSPRKPPRKPSRKKSPAPPPPLDIPPFGSVDNLGRYDQVRPPGSSLRRAGSLEDILHHDENSPVPPPRIKRKQRMRLADIRGKSRSGSDNSESESPERWRRDISAQSHLAKGAASGQYDHLRQLELEMEARKRELERMRLKYAGNLPTDSHQSEVYLDLGGESSDFDDRRGVTYQNVEFSSPSLHATSSRSDTLKTVLRLDEDDDGGQDSIPHEYTNVEFNSRSGLGARSQDRQNKSNNNASLSTSSKVVLSFNDDQDDTKTYEDVVLLSKKRLGEDRDPIPQTFIDGRAEMDTWDRSFDGQNARVVLDLDADQYSTPAIGNISPRSGMTAEEEYIIANRERNARENITTGGRLTTHLSSEGNPDSHDDSISNYNDSVSSADIFSLPKSEIDGHASDSDISDNGGSFHATFEPRTNDDEENDSGITLVSYQNKKSPEHQRRVDQRGVSHTLLASGGGPGSRDRGFPLSPRVAELQQKGSPSPSHSPSPPPLLHSTPPERLPGREVDSDSAEGWQSPQVRHIGLGPNQRGDPQINVLADSSGALIYDSSWEPKSGETGDHVALQPHGTSQGQHYTMDPITGLKRTGVVSPTDKAMVFMHSTEPVIRVKRKEDGINPAVEQERKNILEEMKVRTKKAETWLPDDEIPRLGSKTDSERAYDERRVHLKEQGEKYMVIQPQESAIRYQVSQPKKPG